MNENKNRATFQSRLGFILVSAGCAIGLGNVWKFPYICGQNGGGAFLFLYLICLVLLGLPILICEFAIGRGSNRSLSQAFNRLEKPGSRYHCTKYTSIAGNYLLMMFYTMVTGWMLYYAFKYATGSLDASSTAATAEAFKDMQASPWLMLIFSAIVIILCIGVCALGLQNGIEKVTKFMMILLMALMVVLAVNFDGRKAPYSVEMLSEIDLAYAQTVHKAQGSEYRCVVLAALPSAPSLMVRGGLYTALTRARELLVIVGDDAAIRSMAANDRQQKRYSGLKWRLCHAGDDSE